MVLLSLQHLPKKKHFSQYLQLVLFMTLSGLAVFRVQLFPIDYTKRVCLSVCVCVWLECSTGKVTIVSRNSHESGGQVSGLWLENGYDVSLDWPCKIWILDFSRALYEVPLSKAWPAHC